MLREIEMARVGVHYAAWASDVDAPDREIAAAMAKAYTRATRPTTSPPSASRSTAASATRGSATRTSSCGAPRSTTCCSAPRAGNANASPTSTSRRSRSRVIGDAVAVRSGTHEPMTDPGHRIQWTDVPEYVRADLDARARQRGGRGGQPSAVGVRAVARGALRPRRRAARASIKAVSPAQNPDSPGMMRREARDRGRVCRPTRPRPNCSTSRRRRVDRARVRRDRRAAAAHTVARSTSSTACSPRRSRSAISCRVAVPVHSVAAHYGADVHRLAHALGARGTATRSTDDWCRARIDDLADVEARWERRRRRGDGLIHGDVRERQRAAHRRPRRTSSTGRARAPARRWFEVARDAARRSSSKAAASPRRCCAARRPRRFRSRRRSLPLVVALRRLLRRARPLPGSARVCRPCARSSGRRAQVTNAVVARGCGSRR